MISRKRSHGKRRGFTLIELLVVVAIIALLISILLPSLDRARRQSRQLVCSTNLKSQHDATMLYSADNEDWIVCGMLGIENVSDLYPGYNSYATSILPYLGWKGLKNVKMKPNKYYDIPENVHNLWLGRNAQKNPSSFLPDEVWRARAFAFASMDQLNCPDQPTFETRQSVHWDPDIEPLSPGAMPLDYVSNASPIPYTQKNIDYDSGRMTFEFFVPPEPVDMDLNDYRDSRRIEKLPPGVSAADYIYVTEAHTDLHSKGHEDAFVFHHFFAGAHLPFAYEPRIAVDVRHPGGLPAMFFDGHVEAMELHEIDPACDATDFSCYTKRMRRISYVDNSLAF